VSFARLNATDIQSYLDCREGVGKAGGYAIQGRAEVFVRQISGSYSNVVGLPLFETIAFLKGCGVTVP
jgi:septum formation protein